MGALTGVLPSICEIEGFLLPMYHTKAWGLWLVAALSPLMLTKNPFYLLFAILVLGAEYIVLSRFTATSRQWTMLLRLSLSLAFFGIVFNMLFVNIGATRLVALPVLYIPLGETIIQLGGAITLESLVYGLAQGLGMIGVIVALAIFNISVDHYELLRSVPRILYQSSIALSIAIAFVPQMIRAQAEIRQAQALRGHRFRKLRDLAPLFIALLAEGLERSITLAESMSARGFGVHATRTRRASSTLGTIIALGLFTLVCGIFASSYWSQGFGLLLVAAGSGMLIAALWSISRSTRTSRYKRLEWQPRDSLFAGTAFIVIGIFFSAWAIDRSPLYFYPYPRVTVPSFHPLLASALALLAFPAIVALKTVHTDD